MSWHVEITRYRETAAEIDVKGTYYAADPGDGGQPVHREEVSFPPGTPRNLVLKELGRRGRSMRVMLGRAENPAGDLTGEVFKIDDI